MMADATKVLGQVLPAANTLTQLYNCPALTGTTVSTFTACNQIKGTVTTFRLAVAQGGSPDTPSQYVYWDVDLYDTFAATLGITLATSEKVRVMSGNGAVSFSLFGVEVT